MHVYHLSACLIPKEVRKGLKSPLELKETVSRHMVDGNGSRVLCRNKLNR